MRNSSARRGCDAQKKKDKAAPPHLSRGRARSRATYTGLRFAAASARRRQASAISRSRALWSASVVCWAIRRHSAAYSLYRWAVSAAMQERSPKKLILITRLAQDSSLDRKELCQRPARFVPPCRTRRHIGSTPRIAGGSRAQCPSTARNCLIWRRCGLILPQELKPPRETSRQRKARGDFNPTTEPNRSPIFKLSLS